MLGREMGQAGKVVIQVLTGETDYEIEINIVETYSTGIVEGLIDLFRPVLTTNGSKNLIGKALAADRKAVDSGGLVSS